MPKGKFKIFRRNWWTDNPDYPDGREPRPGPSTVLRYVDTEEEARSYCRRWNETHDPGRLSMKAEYDYA